jgi:hypothetical protein
VGYIWHTYHYFYGASLVKNVAEHCTMHVRMGDTSKLKYFDKKTVFVFVSNLIRLFSRHYVWLLLPSMTFRGFFSSFHLGYVWLPFECYYWLALFWNNRIWFSFVLRHHSSCYTSELPKVFLLSDVAQFWYNSLNRFVWGSISLFGFVMQWFQGGITEAVAASKARNAIFVVFVEG